MAAERWQGDNANPLGDGANPQGDNANPLGDGANPQGDGANPQGDGANPRKLKINFNGKDWQSERQVVGQSIILGLAVLALAGC